MPSEHAKLAGIAARHEEQRAYIVDRVQGAAAVPWEVAEVAAHHALMTMADVLRDEAAAMAKAKTKGHVSVGKDMISAASRIAAYAVKIPGALTAPLAGPAVLDHPSEAATAGPDTASNEDATSEVTPLPQRDPAGAEERVAAARAEAHRLLNPPTVEDAMFQDPSATVPAEIATVDPSSAPRIPGPSIPGSYGPGEGPHAIPQQRMPVDQPGQDYAVGDKVTVGGIEFTKHSENPFPVIPMIPPTGLVDSIPPAVHPEMIRGMDGSLIPTLLGGLPATAPMASLTAPLADPGDPFSDPGGRANARRLTYREFLTMASTLRDEPSKYMSVSKVEALTDCGAKYAFGRLARRGQVPERPQWSSIGGNAFHAWVAALERAVWSNDGKSIPEMPEAALTLWWETCLNTELAETLADTTYTIHDVRVANRGTEGYDWWRVEGAAMCQRYLDHHDDAYRAEWEVLTLGAIAPGKSPQPAIEVEYYLPIVGGLQAHGFMDIIRIHRRTGVVKIDDHKTGRSPGSTFQLASYAHAAMRALGIPGPIVVSNWLARDGAYTDPVEAASRYSWDELVYDYTTAAAMDDQGLFVARPTTFCGGCAFESICPKRYGV